MLFFHVVCLSFVNLATRFSTFTLSFKSLLKRGSCTNKTVIVKKHHRIPVCSTDSVQCIVYTAYQHRYKRNLISFSGTQETPSNWLALIDRTLIRLFEHTSVLDQMIHLRVWSNFDRSNLFLLRLDLLSSSSLEVIPAVDQVVGFR